MADRQLALVAGSSSGCIEQTGRSPPGPLRGRTQMRTCHAGGWPSPRQPPEGGRARRPVRGPVLQ